MSISSRVSCAHDILLIVESLSAQDKPPFYTAVAGLLETVVADLKAPTWQVPVGVAHEQIHRPSFLEPVGLSPVASVVSEEEVNLASLPIVEETAEDAPVSVSVPAPTPTPPTEAEDTRSVGQGTATTNGNRRDFTKFCRALNLQPGHIFTLMKGPKVDTSFTLQYVAGKAMLYIDCPDGTRISANSPSGVVQRYIRKTKGKIVSTNGWDRLNMQWNRTNTFFPISSSIWNNCSWNVQQSSFHHDA